MCWTEVLNKQVQQICLLKELTADDAFQYLQAVEMFLDEKIGYMDIVKVVEKCCDTHQQEFLQKPSLDEIVHYDQWARNWVSSNVDSKQTVAA